MKVERRGLWVEVALALALLSLATILLNAGVFWLLLKKTEEHRRTEFALSLSSALSAQLERAALQRADGGGYKRVLTAYQGSGIELDELYVVTPTMKVAAGTAGTPPKSPDAGLRAALYGKEQHSEVTGLLWGRRSVEVTTPIAPTGRVTAALRVKMPLHLPVPGGPAGFVLIYTVFSGAAIALFGFSLLRRRLIQPIRSLQEGTKRIAGGDFGTQVSVDASSELQELSDALSVMSLSLQEYRDRSEEQVGRLRSANQELRAAQEALIRSERLAGVGRLAAGLAHEVGNPLSAVLGYLELLAGGLDDPALEHDLLERSQRELGRIHSIIRQLLDYARAGAGQAELVGLTAAAREAVGTFSPQPAYRGIEIALEAPERDLEVLIERDKLHQVMVNLLLNAGDALDGCAEQRVTLVISGDAARATLRCMDTGPGFSEVALDRAFEPFYTTRDVGRGTGLGLATALQVIEQAGGRMWARNSASGGAEVGFELPCSGTQNAG